MRSRERDERGARASRVTLCDRARDVPDDSDLRTRKVGGTNPKLPPCPPHRSRDGLHDPAPGSNRDLRTGRYMVDRTRPSRPAAMPVAVPRPFRDGSAHGTARGTRTGTRGHRHA